MERDSRGGFLVRHSILAKTEECLKSSTDIPVCVLVARGSGGAMEKMPAGCQRSDGETENWGKFGSAVHEFHELTRIIPDIQTIIGV